MAFLIEDGTGIANANSYVSVDYADDYFLLRDITAWATLTNKEALLIKATDYIEAVYGQSWNYAPLTDTQGLTMPRVDVYGVAIFPDALLKATCELALKASDGELLVDTEQRAIKEEVGSIKVTYAEYSDQLTQYGMVYNLLTPYLISGGAYSQSVVRT